MARRARRQKISTTIAPENQTFLRSLIKHGKATNLGEAIDRTVSFARRAEARRQREAATEAYYASLSGKALQEEKKLELAVAAASSLVDFDAE